MMAAGLRALGLEPLPSTANFLLVDLGSPERAPGGQRGACSRAGVIVRPARAFGAPVGAARHRRAARGERALAGRRAEALAEAA